MSTETAPAPTPAPSTPVESTSAGQTIHDALDAIFAPPAKAAPKAEFAPVAAVGDTETAAPTATVAEGDGAPAVVGEATQAEPAKEPEAPAQISRADYAIQLARAKRKIAKLQAQTPSSKPTPSESAIALAAQLEAAGDDHYARFKALGLDLGKVTDGAQKELSDPESPDPLAREIKTLRDRIAAFEAEKEAAKEADAVRNFFSVVESQIKAGGDEYEFVAAHGQDGLDLVKELVLEAARIKKPITVAEALKDAEQWYAHEAETLAKTKKLAKKLAPPPTKKRPGIGSGSPAAAPAPTTTKPVSVTDAIENELEALGFH